MYIAHKHLENLRKSIRPGKVVVIYGARRTGKTTLLREFLKAEREPYLLVSGEDIAVQNYLASQSVEKLTAFVGHNRLLVIDEAQHIEQIGLMQLANTYFWRTYRQQELDLVEERQGRLYGYEMKWGERQGKTADGVAGCLS